tara:strand:+ start:153 stop:335 length:183 start_codon:yes stop_codon:yes gene_type:complete
MSVNSLEKTREDYADLIDQLGSPDSPVGIDAQYTHAVIIQFLQNISERLEKIEKALDGDG